MGRESAPCRPEHLGEVVFIRDLSDNDLCLTSIFGGTASIHCGSRFPGRNGTFRHSFGQIIPTVRRSPSFSHAQSLPSLQLFMLRLDVTVAEIDTTRQPGGLGLSRPATAVWQSRRGPSLRLKHPERRRSISRTSGPGSSLPYPPDANVGWTQSCCAQLEVCSTSLQGKTVRPACRVTEGPQPPRRLGTTKAVEVRRLFNRPWSFLCRCRSVAATRSFSRPI